MSDNFPKLLIDTKLQIPEVQRIPCQLNTKKSTARHIIRKLQKKKDKEKTKRPERGETSYLMKDQGQELQQSSLQKPCIQEESGLKSLHG